MAMSGEVLAPLIKEAFNAKYLVANPAYAAIIDDIDPFITALCEAVAEQTVAHIQAAGEVVVISVGGVTTGPGVSGPGTGTIL